MTSPRSHRTRRTCFSTSGSACRDSGLTGSSVLQAGTEGLAVSFGSSSDTFSVKVTGFIIFELMFKNLEAPEKLMENLKNF